MIVDERGILEILIDKLIAFQTNNDLMIMLNISKSLEQLNNWFEIYIQIEVFSRI